LNIDGTVDRKASWFCDGADKNFGIFLSPSCFWVEEHSGQDQNCDDRAAIDFFFDDNTYAY